jgi:hypothetical protein
MIRFIFFFFVIDGNDNTLHGQDDLRARSNHLKKMLRVKDVCMRSATV